jgi:hypothetical protein
MFVWGMQTWIRETQTQTRIYADVEYIKRSQSDNSRKESDQSVLVVQGSIAQRRGKTKEEKRDILPYKLNAIRHKESWSTTARKALAGKTTNGRSRSRPALLPRIWHGCSIH